jgi:hypothetical protein
MQYIVTVQIADYIVGILFATDFDLSWTKLPLHNLLNEDTNQGRPIVLCHEFKLLDLSFKIRIKLGSSNKAIERSKASNDNEHMPDCLGKQRHHCNPQRNKSHDVGQDPTGHERRPKEPSKNQD